MHIYIYIYIYIDFKGNTPIVSFVTTEKYDSMLRETMTDSIIFFTIASGKCSLTVRDPPYPVVPFPIVPNKC